MQRSKLMGGFAALMVGGVMAVGATGALAQPPGGGFSMPPEIKAKIAAWKKYSEEHKNLTTLSKTMRAVETMNKEPETRLDKQQSAKMLTIVNTWKSKPDMSDDDAKNVQKQISGMLNIKQIKRMSMPDLAGGFGGGGQRPGGGGGFGKMGGGGKMGGPGGMPKFPDPPKGTFNPMNADTLPFEQMRPMAKKSMEEFTSSLQKQAK